MPQGRRRLGKARKAPPPPPPFSRTMIFPSGGELTHDESIRLQALDQACSYSEKRGLRTGDMLEVAKKFEAFIKDGAVNSTNNEPIPGERQVSD